MEDDVQEYVVQSTSSQSAQVEDIEISRSSDGSRRKVLRTVLVVNERDENQSVKATIVCQRQSSSVTWVDIEGQPLSRLHAGEASKLSLDSAETFALVNRLNDLYGIDQNGAMRGRRVINIAHEDAVIETEEGRARLLRKIAESENLEDLASISNSENMSPSETFAISAVVANRRKVLEKFDEMLADDSFSEHDWQELLKSNKWLFGVETMQVIDESRLSIHHDTDIPYQVHGGFMDIVELKLPSHNFWRRNRDGTLFLYRSKFPVEGNEVANGLAQLRNYILEAEKGVSNADFIRDHGGVIPLKPRGTLIIGRSNNWTVDEWKAYRLFNDELHGVQAMTFDQLRERAQQSIEGLMGND